MAIIFALPHLFDAVAARFAAEGTLVPMAFGWRAPAEQIHGTRRIVWIPGDAGGGLGALGAAKWPGQNPRSLATLSELCTVEITAFDDITPEDERAQYQAARELFDAWLRAVYLEAHGTYQIVSATWVGGDRARRAGATIRVVFAVQAPIFDEPVAIADVDTQAELNLHELDVHEPQTVPAA